MHFSRPAFLDPSWGGLRAEPLPHLAPQYTPMAQPGGAQLQPGGAQGARFQGIRTLGKGAHGFVQLAIDHKCDGQQVAIKYIPRRVHMACSGRGDPVVLIVTGHHRRGETASFYKYVLREVRGGACAPAIAHACMGRSP